MVVCSVAKLYGHEDGSVLLIYFHPYIAQKPTFIKIMNYIPNSLINVAT